MDHSARTTPHERCSTDDTPASPRDSLRRPGDWADDTTDHAVAAFLENEDWVLGPVTFISASMSEAESDDPADESWRLGLKHKSGVATPRASGAAAPLPAPPSGDMLDVL